MEQTKQIQEMKVQVQSFIPVFYRRLLNQRALDTHVSSDFMLSTVPFIFFVHLLNVCRVPVAAILQNCTQYLNWCGFHLNWLKSLKQLSSEQTDVVAQEVLEGEWFLTKDLVRKGVEMKRISNEIIDGRGFPEINIPKSKIRADSKGFFALYEFVGIFGEQKIFVTNSVISAKTAICVRNQNVYVCSSDKILVQEAILTYDVSTETILVVWKVTDDNGRELYPEKTEMLDKLIENSLVTSVMRYVRETPPVHVFLCLETARENLWWLKVRTQNVENPKAPLPFSSGHKKVVVSNVTTIPVDLNVPFRTKKFINGFTIENPKEKDERFKSLYFGA